MYHRILHEVLGDFFHDSMRMVGWAAVQTPKRVGKRSFVLDFGGSVGHWKFR